MLSEIIQNTTTQWFEALGYPASYTLHQYKLRETILSKQSKEKFGYNRFDFFYLDYSEGVAKNIASLDIKLKEFFYEK
jgi:hypothetical protein